MRVHVLVAGLYNGPGHHDPVKAEPGDVIEVAGGWYAAALMDAGLVTQEDAAPQEGRPHDAPPGPSESQAATGADEKPGRSRRTGGRK